MSRRRRLRLARTVCFAGLLSVGGYVLVALSTAAGPRQVQPEDLFRVPAIHDYLAKSGRGITAAVYDVVDRRTSTYAPGRAEDTASIMKVDILATLLRQSQSQDVPLTFEQQELSQEMIEESNDDDAQDLWDAEGGAPAVTSFDAEAGLTHTIPDVAGYWGLSTTTATDQLQLLKTIAFPNSVLNDASRGYELGLMTDVDPHQAWGVSGGVPADVTVAIKDGWLPLDDGDWQINSIGYVHGDGCDYLIAVLSDRNTTEEDGIDTIGGLSKLIWRQLAHAGEATQGKAARHDLDQPGTAASAPVREPVRRGAS